MTDEHGEYRPPADPGHGYAQSDDATCPECHSGSLVAWVDGVAYRHCSYVSCDWGIRSDVIVTAALSVSSEQVANP